MFQLGSEGNPGAKVLVERKVKIESDDHWVSVDTTSKTSFDDAWWGGVFKVQSPILFRVCILTITQPGCVHSMEPLPDASIDAGSTNLVYLARTEANIKTWIKSFGSWLAIPSSCSPAVRLKLLFPDPVRRQRKAVLT